MTNVRGDEFGKRVGEYIAGRPEYPHELLEALPTAGADLIVDLGAGTGKFTNLLAHAGSRIVAVEPDAHMAARVRRGQRHPITVVCALAEHLPLAKATADLICCATAFHWFDYPKSTAEIYRLLKPGRCLALIWNVRDDRVGWVARVSRLLDRYAGTTPRHSSGKWRVIFDDRRFSCVSQSAYPFTQPMPVTGIRDRVLSTSFIAALPTEPQTRVCAEVEEVIGSDDALRTDQMIMFPYVSELYLFRRIP